MSVTPPGSRSSSPRRCAGCSVAARVGDRRRAARRSPPRPRWRRARWPGCRARAAASRVRTSPAGVRHVRGRAVEPAVLDRASRARRRARRCRTSRRGRRTRRRAPRSRGSSALATSTSSGARLLEDLRLGVGDRVGGREEPEVRVADVGPHADVRLRDADERADFAGMIHAELDDRHLRPRPQLEERERQADVVVQVPLVAKHPVPRRQKLRRDFLRRRLARAAGDRHDPRARSPPDVARHVLQRRASCRPPR